MEVQEVISPVWTSLTRPPVKLIDFKYDQYIQVPLTDNISNVNSLQTYTFQLSDAKNWYRPSRAGVLVSVKVTHGDGTVLNAGESAALMNGGWNLFRRPRLTYGQQALHVPEKDYCGPLANIQGLAEYSEDYARAGASSAGFYPDTADGSTSTSAILINTAADAAALGGSLGALMAQIAPKFAFSPNAFNQGYYDRSNAAAQSGILTFWLPLRDFCGFLKHTDMCLRGQQLELNLDRETNNARIIHATSSATAGLQVVFTDLQLWIPQVMPPTELGAQLDLQIAAGTRTRIAYKDWHIFHTNNGTNSSINWNPGNIKNPLRFVFAMYDSTVNTDQTKNAGIFLHNKLQNLQVLLAGVPYPTRQIKPDFPNNSYVRTYHDFLEIFGKTDPVAGLDHSSIVNYKRFKDLYPLICGDLSHRNTAVSDLNALLRVDVEANIDPANAINNNLVLMIETDEEIILKGNGTGFEIEH